ncbi:MAG: hypothetical protein JWR67_3810 [Mucilaginibacter sp.]|nr:hypothetical protein [Mucilaginibacter sp.]
MNNIFLKVALGAAFLTTVAIGAQAQKTYTEGVITYSIKSSMGDADSKVSFRGDSSSSSSQYGPAVVKLISTAKGNYFAVLVNVPVASIKKAAVLTPDELDQANAAAPKFTFTPTTETKQINGFNCKKVTVKDSKGTSFDAWVTNDIVAPQNLMSKYFEGAGGFPVQFATMQQGQQVSVILKSISDEKVPAGTFGIPAGYDKITYEELMAMSGKRQ